MRFLDSCVFITFAAKNQDDMSEQELHSYRLSSLEEPTDEMLQAIMQGVAEAAVVSTHNAKEELNRRFNELKIKIARSRQNKVSI